MSQKPAIPKGTRDFLPQDVAKRNYIFDTIKSVFQLYGFAPIETPSFELSTTLMGKYGEEGDRLIFKILNSGEYFEKYTKILRSYLKSVYKIVVKNIYENLFDNNNYIKEGFNELKYVLSEELINKITVGISNKHKIDFPNIYHDELIELITDQILLIQRDQNLKFKTLIDILSNCIDCDPLDNENVKDFIEKKVDITNGIWMNKIKSSHLTTKISEKALRYDLTVPFARFVVQHQNELSFPFKRYQIQPVWRADRPQHGRYQEFYQCDADVVGSDSLLYEVELIQIFDAVLTDLNLPGFTIQMNNRKILSGIAEVSGESEKLIDITVAIDKLDKVGEEGVVKELAEKGVSASAIERIQPLFSLSGTNDEKIALLTEFLKDSEIGLKGIEELKVVLNHINRIGLRRGELLVDVTLARGLNYYTGAIFEVKAKDVKMGSICGGGRYDDLTGLFGLKGVSGVGISFGADRIYDVLNELNLFPSEVTKGLPVLFVNFGAKEAEKCLDLANELRANKVACEVYPSAAKLQKQMKYANDRNVQFVVLIGENELNTSSFVLKNMETGEQTTSKFEELSSIFSLSK